VIWCRSDETRLAIEQLEISCQSIWSITSELFARLAYGGRDDGVVAVAEPTQRGHRSAAIPSLPLVDSAWRVSKKPGNVGAVLRSADAAGVSAFILADSATDLYNPNTIRASLGTVFTVPTCIATASETRDWLRRS